jgi:hypothetical protein
MTTYQVRDITTGTIDYIECDYFILKSEINQILFIKRKDIGNQVDGEPRHELVGQFQADRYNAKKMTDE